MLFGPNLPEVGEVVHTKKGPCETGTVTAVQRNGFGYFETFATCQVCFPDGTERDCDERDLVRHH
jgi:hypothetical protein